MNDKVREALLKKASSDWSGGATAIGVEEAIEVFNNLDLWQPIETAPKDGTEFLAIDNGGYYFVAWWNEDAFQSIDDIIDSLTHWQPLPKPPEKK